MCKVNKLIASNIVYDNIGKSHTFNICKDGGYYFTIDGIKLDWSFPSISKQSAFSHYNNICDNPDEVTSILNWALGDI